MRLERTASNSLGGGSTPAFRTRMDFAACCMSQGLSLALTRPRSCELSPGHALGPSARVAGVCPPSARFKDLRSTKASFRVRHRGGHPHPAPRCEDCRDAPLIGSGWLTILSYRERQEQKTNIDQLFFLKIRKRMSVLDGVGGEAYGANSAWNASNQLRARCEFRQCAE